MNSSKFHGRKMSIPMGALGLYLKPLSLEETKNLVMNLMRNKFPGGATHRMITVEIEDMRVYVVDRRLYDALKVLIQDKDLNVVDLPRGRGRRFSVNLEKAAV